MRHTTPRDSADRHGNSMSRMPVQKVDDTKPIQQHMLNGFSGESMDTIEHMHPYGFTTVPVKPSGGEGPEGMTMFMGSNRSHGIVVASADRRFRPYKLDEGDVALHDNKGHQIHLKAADGIHISAPNSKKVQFHVMDDDKLPQDGKLNQVQQAGRAATPNSLLTKDEHTDTHPKQNTHQIVDANKPPPSGGDVSSQLSGLATQAQALATAGVGLPGIQDIGSQIAGMSGAITGAGGSSGAASAITAIGTSMASGSMGGMGGLLSSLTSQISSLTSSLNPAGAMSKVLHTHVLDKAQGIMHSVFSGSHTVQLGQAGIALQSAMKIASTAPKLPHNGSVTNSDSVSTTGASIASSFPIISDARLKTDIEDHPSVLDDIMSLKVKRFYVKTVDWENECEHDSPARESIGLLAQDVQKVFPLLVHGDKFLAIEEGKIGLLLLAAFQEFVTEVRDDLAKLKQRDA